MRNYQSPGHRRSEKLRRRAERKAYLAQKRERYWQRRSVREAKRAAEAERKAREARFEAERERRAAKAAALPQFSKLDEGYAVVFPIEGEEEPHYLHGWVRKAGRKWEAKRFGDPEWTGPYRTRGDAAETLR